MYIPKINLETNRDAIVDLMKQFSFATVITSFNNVPTPTHLPFLVKVREKEVILTLDVLI